MKTLASVLLGLAVVGPANAQAGRPGPDIVRPASNIRLAGDSIHKRYTRYLHFQGEWRHSSMDDITPVATLMHGPAAAPSGPSGYHPSDIRSAYGMPSSGGQDAIAIVDAYSDSYILSDFNTFSSTFGLPTETSSSVTASTNQVLQVVYAAGTAPPVDSGWAGEESLDVEWAHSVAPKAKIYLVEAAGSDGQSLDNAVAVAEALPNVKEVSMSWGAGFESPSEQQEDSVFTYPGVVYYAATGDSPGEKGYPAMSPNVVACGGSSMDIVDGTVLSEQVWYNPPQGGYQAYGPGCGDSQYVARPAFQNGVANIVGNFRGTPDICADADPNTGVAVFNSNDIGQPYNQGGWEVDGGTSLATPLCAAIANVRGSFSASSTAEHTSLYSQEGTPYIRDITAGEVIGTDGTVYRPAVGYDLASGLGEPVGTFSTQVVTSAPATAAPVAGTHLGGNLASLQAVDGNCYVVGSKLLIGHGQQAGAQIAYTVTAPTGYPTLSSLTIAVDASAVAGADESIEALNLKTGAYDVLGTAALSTGGGLTTVSVNPAAYLASNGTITVRLAATRSESYGLSAFGYRIDEAVMTATFSAK
jgi:hypothetical protein